MLYRYFDWVVRIAYRTDRFTHYADEPQIGKLRTTLGGMVAELLVGWPFITIGVIAFLLPVSDGKRIAIIALDAFVLSVASTILAIRIYKMQKADSANWLAREEQKLHGQNQAEAQGSNLTNASSDSSNVDKRV